MQESNQPDFRKMDIQTGKNMTNGFKVIGISILTTNANSQTKQELKI